MLSTSIFKKHKCDTDSLKKLATAAKKSEGWTKLVGLIRDRIKDGRERSLKDYRIWAEVDLAYDAPLHQGHATLLRHIMSNGGTANEIQSAVKSWGLCEGSLFCTVKGENGAKDSLMLNMPMFNEVFIPCVRAYTLVRLSKIFNDRNLNPLFQYEPQKYTELNRVRCEIVTDIVQTMATMFGYADDLKQMILNTLLYSECLEFPVEAWTCDKQEDGDGKEYTVREGVRHVRPHITQTFRDLQYSPTTFNTDTGCTFGGYWRTMRAGDVLDNKLYWNTEAISYTSTNWFDKESSYANYFKQVFPCTLSLPVFNKDSKKETNRERVQNLYSNTDFDKAIFVTDVFMKIVPSDYGIGTYKYPIWFQFIVGSDDAILFAMPYAYRPITYAGYDPDQNRALNASLALEIVPFQTSIGNTFNQIYLTIKRNLSNIVFYDTRFVKKEHAELLKQRSQTQYTEINLIPFNGLDAFKQGTSADNSFKEVKFAYADVSAMFNQLSMQLAMLERMLGISPQEIGAAASHQQGNKEIELINSGSTNRVAYTASSIDNAIDAKKKQLYEAAMAYMDSDVSGQVSADIPNVEARIKELGFEYNEKNDKAGSKLVVKGKKEKLLTLEQFASTKDGPDRTASSQEAQALLLGIQSLNQNQAAASVVDPESIVTALEEVMKLGGVRKDFKFKINKEQAAAQQLGAMIEQIKKFVTDSIAENMKPAAEAVHEQEQKIEQAQQQIAQVVQALEKIQQMVTMAQAAPPLPAAPQPMPLEQPMQQPLVPPLADASQPQLITTIPEGQAPVMA